MCSLDDFEGSLLPCGIYSIITLAVLKHSLHMFIVLQTGIQIIETIVRLNRADKLSIQKSLQCSFCGDVKVLKVWAEWDSHLWVQCEAKSSAVVFWDRRNPAASEEDTLLKSYSFTLLQSNGTVSSAAFNKNHISSCLESMFRVDTPQKVFARRDISTRE